MPIQDTEPLKNELAVTTAAAATATPPRCSATRIRRVSQPVPPPTPCPATTAPLPWHQTRKFCMLGDDTADVDGAGVLVWYGTKHDLDEFEPEDTLKMVINTTTTITTITITITADATAADANAANTANATH